MSGVPGVIKDLGAVPPQWLLDNGLNAFAFELTAETWADFLERFRKQGVPFECVGVRLRWRTHSGHGDKLVEITVEEVADKTTEPRPLWSETGAEMFAALLSAPCGCSGDFRCTRCLGLDAGRKAGLS